MRRQKDALFVWVFVEDIRRVGMCKSEVIAKRSRQLLELLTSFRVIAFKETFQQISTWYSSNSPEENICTNTITNKCLYNYSNTKTTKLLFESLNRAQMHKTPFNRNDRKPYTLFLWTIRGMFIEETKKLLTYDAMITFIEELCRLFHCFQLLRTWPCLVPHILHNSIYSHNSQNMYKPLPTITKEERAGKQTLRSGRESPIQFNISILVICQNKQKTINI